MLRKNHYHVEKRVENGKRCFPDDKEWFRRTKTDWSHTLEKCQRPNKSMSHGNLNSGGVQNWERFSLKIFSPHASPKKVQFHKIPIPVFPP